MLTKLLSRIIHVAFYMNLRWRYYAFPQRLQSCPHFQKWERESCYMPFMKKRSLTTGICTAGIFMFSQEKSENGSLGRKSNGKGASREDRAPKKKKS